MDKNAVIFIVEKDDQRFSIIKQNLNEVGIWNKIIRLKNSTELLDFLPEFANDRIDQQPNRSIVIFDSSADQPDSANILKAIKQDQRYKKIPVIVFADSDRQNDIDNCYSLGCSMYFAVKNGEKNFAQTAKDAGVFLSFITLPELSADQNN